MSTLSMCGVAARIRSRVIEELLVVDLGACWIWQGGKTRDGYGKIKADGKTVGVHRAAFLAFKGAIPRGHVIDHICRQRLCCNPTHLRAVTQSTNVRHALRRQVERRIAEKKKAKVPNLQAWVPFKGEGEIS